MTKRHAHVAHMAEHMNIVGGPLWWGVMGPGPLGPPKSGAWLYSPAADLKFPRIVLNAWSCAAILHSFRQAMLQQNRMGLFSTATKLFV